MAYDLGLAERLSGIVRKGQLVEKKMFGGLGWLLNGNMCLGIYKDKLILRVGDEAAAKLLKEKHIKIMYITGEPMKGWLMMAPDGYADDADLTRLTKIAITFVKTLPSEE